MLSLLPLLPLVIGCAAVALPQEPSTSSEAGAIAIIPRPTSLKVAPDSFALGPDVRILAAGPAVPEARKLQDALAPALGYRLDLVEVREISDASVLLELEEVRDPSIALRLDPSLERLGDEGYELVVSPRRIALRARGAAGLFWGIQTLRQLLPPANFRKAAVAGVEWKVPCVEIADVPRFQWRGLLVDPARHFLPRSAVLRLLDAMAIHKLNSLQMHLTDDQGWRIEIRKYPRLAEVGAWREETLVGQPGSQPWKFDGRPHGGYYTHDDIREIVRYAADRHIVVVPEIEMPGHARAAISAYPRLGCKPETTLRPWTHWGVCPDIFCPTDETVAFLKDVLAEVTELFPSRFIHIGGDEAVKDQWRESPAVQARIRELGLKDEAELQSWLVRQMDEFLASRGRRLVGWDEILEGGLAPGATVMSWRGEQGGIAAARAGHDVVMAPTSHTYLDYYQGPAEKEPLAIGGFLPLRTVYEYDPVPSVLTQAEARHVLGAQGQLWGEYIPTPRHLEYMAFPRAAALAEVVWSAKEGREYADFLSRLRWHLRRLDALDVAYRALDP